MSRAKNPNREKAELLYIESGGKIPLVEIANTLDIPEGTVRSWKNRYKWDSLLNSEDDATLQKEKRNVAKKKNKGGAPKGNKNAVGNKGGGAPKGNKNRVVTGEFETIFFDSLSEEESALIEAVDIDKYNLIKHELQLLTVREYRMMKKIEKIKTSTKGLNIKDVTKRKLESKNVPYVSDADLDVSEKEASEGKKYKHIEEETITHTISDFELLYKLEEALTRIQARKIVCINLLAKMEESAERLKLEKERLNKDSGGDGNIDELMNSIDAARNQRRQRGDS